MDLFNILFLLFAFFVNLFVLKKNLKPKHLKILLGFIFGIPIALLLLFRISLIAYDGNSEPLALGFIIPSLFFFVLFLPYFFPVVLYKLLRNKFLFALTLLPFIFFNIPHYINGISAINLKKTNPSFVPTYLPPGAILNNKLPDFQVDIKKYSSSFGCYFSDEFDRINIDQEIVGKLTTGKLLDFSFNNPNLQKKNLDKNYPIQQTYKFNGQDVSGQWMIIKTFGISMPTYNASFYANGSNFEIYLDGNCLINKKTEYSQSLDFLAISEMSKIISGLKEKREDLTKDYLELFPILGLLK